MKKEIEKRLTDHGVRPSPVRSLVFEVLLNADAPMSSLDVETALETVDRSSISRSVATFLRAGLLHSIADGTGVVKYEVCRSDNEQSDSDEHVHFRCERCGRTICLTDVPVPEVTLPNGFTARQYNFVVTGVCDKCNNSKTDSDGTV